MFIVAVAKCLTEAAEGELILFMVLEDSAHGVGWGGGHHRGDGAGLSAAALVCSTESKQTGSVGI